MKVTNFEVSLYNHQQVKKSESNFILFSNVKLDIIVEICMGRIYNHSILETIILEEIYIKLHRNLKSLEILIQRAIPLHSTDLHLFLKLLDSRKA